MVEKEPEADEFCRLIDDLKLLISDGCASFLKENGIYEEGMGDEAAIEAFDAIRFIPLNVYERYPSNFALRFAGIGADVEACRRLAELHEWVLVSAKNTENRRSDVVIKLHEFLAAPTPMANTTTS